MAERSLFSSLSLLGFGSALAGSLAAIANEPDPAEFRVCFLEQDLPRADRAHASGLDLELMTLLAGQLGRTLVPVWSPSQPAFAEIEDSDLPLDALLAGRCDAVASVPGETALGEHAEHLRLSRPYYGAAFELVGAAGVPSQLEELGERPVAVQLQSLGHFAAQALGLTWKAGPSTEEVLGLLDQGEAEAALVWGPSLAGSGRALLAGYEPPQALRFNEHLAVRAGDAALLERLDAGLESLLAGGTVERLLRTYGIPFRPPFPSTSDRAALRALGVGSPASPAAAYASDPEALKRASQVFRAVCTGYCHSTGTVQKEAPDLFDCTWSHGSSDQEIFDTVSGGVPATQMQAFGGKLPDEDLWKLVAYLRSRSKCQK